MATLALYDPSYHQVRRSRVRGFRQAMRNHYTLYLGTTEDPTGRGTKKLSVGAALAASIVLVMAFSTNHAALAQSQQAGPLITGVTDSASYSAYIAWGELVSIFGTNLSDGGIYRRRRCHCQRSLARPRSSLLASRFSFCT
jgi:hypothetical protein